MDLKSESLSGHSRVVATEDQLSCNLGGEVAILGLGSGMYFTLTPVGARIWDLIQEPRSVSDILEVLLGEYEVAADRCEHDLLDLLRKLAAHGLVEIQNGNGQ